MISTVPVLRPWYHDAASCLHATLGVVIAATAGVDPLDVCGLGWEFRYRPGDVRTEEFYWPAADPDDPVASITPHHLVRSAWRRSVGDDPLGDLAAALAAGRFPIAAVDNFHLPFRPAYHDVHAAHLVVVTGLRDDVVHLCDPVPPAFQGPIPRADFLRSWASANERDAQDRFFSSEPIDRRWLEVTVTGPVPPVDPAACARALRANQSVWLAGPTGGDLTGLPGMAEVTAALAGRIAAGDRAAAVEGYVFGWCMQAQAALHGELLRRLGSRWSCPELAAAGRRVEQVAHAWTPVRITAAHAATFDEPVHALPHHAERLRHAYRAAVGAVGAAVGAVDTLAPGGAR